MSYYEKKYIKGDHKKHDCKEECKKDDHKYDYHEEENGLLTEFDVDQIPSVPVTSTTPGLPTTLSNPFAEVEVCVDDRGDRVALDATIDWTPTPLDIVGVITGILALISATAAVGLTLPLAVSATFRIWRKSSSGTVLVSEKTDTSPLSGITLVSFPAGGPALSRFLFGETTTSIHAVDTNPDLGENEYFLTISATPVIAGTSVTNATGTALVPFPGFVLTTSNINSFTFTASEIEEND
ncbi:hypothetical protein [Priestia megaterium]|uniref:hypothetical protein n=1 Tax=Priestia megaterium TaxID=1404 RepID=UPI003459BE9B